MNIIHSKLSKIENSNFSSISRVNFTDAYNALPRSGTPRPSRPSANATWRGIVAAPVQVEYPTGHAIG